MALLTPRDRDLVRLAVEGMRNQEISVRRNVSEHTVRPIYSEFLTSWAYRAAWN
jgi:DNA-binding NarL/FixJ family response regulator